MIKKFRSSKITLSVAEGKLYDETTNFTEQNVDKYLAEVEEYIKCLLTVIGEHFEIKCPILMSLGLNELPPKIEAPVFVKDPLLPTDEEPDNDTLNDMLDKTKYNSMMRELLDKHNETSKMLIEETKDEGRETIEDTRQGHGYDRRQVSGEADNNVGITEENKDDNANVNENGDRVENENRTGNENDNSPEEKHDDDDNKMGNLAKEALVDDFLDHEDDNDKKDETLKQTPDE